MTVEICVFLKVMIKKSSLSPVRGAKNITVNVFCVSHSIWDRKYFTFTTFHHNVFCDQHQFHQPPDSCKMLNPGNKPYSLPVWRGFLLECSGGTMSQLLQVLPPKITSSLWWLRHMLALWQRRTHTTPTPRLKVCPPETQVNQNTLLTSNLWHLSMEQAT